MKEGMKISEGSWNREILKFSKCAMIGAGIWRLPLHEHTLLRKIYVAYSATAQLLFTLLIMLLTVRIGTSKNDKLNKEVLFRVIAYTVTTFVALIKVIICQTSRVKRIISYIIEEEKKLANSDDENIQRCHLWQVKLCRRMNCVIVGLLSVMGAATVTENLNQRNSIQRYNEEHNASLLRPFVYDAYYLNIDTEKHGTLLVCVNLFVAVIAVLECVSTQIIFLSSINFGCLVLKVIRIRYRRMLRRSDDVVGTLKMLVVEHQNVIAFVENLNNEMKYLMLLEYLLTSLNIASVLIQCLMADDKSMFVSRICYFIWLCVNIFALGWCANEVKVQSLALADTIYKCRWYEHTEKAKRIMFIMMMRAQRPLVLTSGPFDEVTLETSLTVMKAAYSYVSLMSQKYR